MVEHEVMRPGRIGSRRAMTLVEALVVFGIVAALAGLLLPAVQWARHSANRARCADHLRQTGLALHNYHAAHHVLPPGVSVRDGTDPYPYLAWMARLLPYLEQEDAWRETVRAFATNLFFMDVPPHTNLIRVMPPFTCPSDRRTLSGRQSMPKEPSPPVAFTAFLGNGGTNLFRLDGVLFRDSRVCLTDVTDGTSTTLLAGERPPSADGVFGWWYAGWGQNKDGSADSVLGVRERHVDIRMASCPPGPYHFVPGNPKDQCDALHFWSLHPGGAHFLFCDGSVRFLTYSADSVLPALATRAGGETTAFE